MICCICGSICVATPSSVCANSNASYSIASVPSATSYNWTVPTGATITAGQGTAAISVHYGTAAGNITCAATNICGTGVTKTLAITMHCRLISEENSQLRSQFETKLFPNPASDFISVTTNSTEKVKLEIYDLNGRLLLSDENVNSSKPINIAGLDNGIYFVKFQEKDIVSVNKFFVAR